MKAKLVLATFASLELHKQQNSRSNSWISTKFVCFNNKIYNYIDIMCYATFGYSQQQQKLIITKNKQKQKI